MRVWGHEYVITSLLENAVSWKTKRGGPPSVVVLSTYLIQSHAPCLSGRRPSSAVHHFGQMSMSVGLCSGRFKERIRQL